MDRPPRRPTLLLLAVALAAAPIALAVEPPLVSCPPAYAPGDSFGQQGFYVPSFPGTSLASVELHLMFPAAGTYVLSLTAHAGTFDGTGLGTATSSVTAGADLTLPVLFTFPSPAVTPGTPVAFTHAKTSGPAGTIFFGVITQLDSCPVVETLSFTPPLSAFNRTGIAVVIRGGKSPLGYPKTAVVPAVASVHGANGTFFHSDLHVVNRSSNLLNVTARYRCYSGQSCGTGVASFTLDSHSVKTFPDVVASLFSAPETAGAVELSYNSYVNDDTVKAFSRVYTPSLPNPTNGAAVPGYPGHQATGGSVFFGIANAATRSSGFRTNAGAYNPNPRPVTVTFSIYRNTGTVNDAALLGTVTGTWDAHEARQVNDLFATAGIGSTVITDAILVAGADQPVFIDNVTGDSVFQGPTPW